MYARTLSAFDQDYILIWKELENEGSQIAKKGRIKRARARMKRWKVQSRKEMAQPSKRKAEPRCEGASRKGRSSGLDI
jgi:hypothetical protein